MKGGEGESSASKRPLLSSTSSLRTRAAWIYQPASDSPNPQKQSHCFLPSSTHTTLGEWPHLQSHTTAKGSAISPISGAYMHHNKPSASCSHTFQEAQQRD